MPPATYMPEMSPRGLIPKGCVEEAPGMSIVVGLPTLVKQEAMSDAASGVLANDAIYVRGLAYLAARQPTAAAFEFQRILDHRSIVLVDPMDAMARLQLARAFALSGDTVKAKNAYSDLLTLWKNADPDLPVLKQARAEYAKLS